jgi:hypothetical protein
MGPNSVTKDPGQQMGPRQETAKQREVLTQRVESPKHKKEITVDVATVKAEASNKMAENVCFIIPRRPKL